MSNITNITSSSDGADSVVASIAGIFVFLGTLFFCFYFIPKWCCKKARQRFDMQNGRTKRYNKPVQAYPTPVQAYPVQIAEISEATSVSIVDPELDRKSFFLRKGIDLPCDNIDLDRLYTLYVRRINDGVKRKYNIDGVYFLPSRGPKRGMYVIIDAEAYLIDNLFDGNRLKKSLGNPSAGLYFPKKTYDAKKLVETYFEWQEQREKQGLKLNF